MDSPILSSDDDDLRRAPSAGSLVRSIRKLDASKGLVVGIQGPWGFGKSSFINLMREGFAEKPEIVVVDFNPWMFSGSDQLVSLFFSQIGAELKLKGGNRFDAIAAGLDKYADALSPLANFIPIPGAGILAGFLRRILGGAVAKKRAAQSDIHGIRDSIVDTLKKLDQPIVVVIDDIDRLTTPEIREIFKLVRLTGNFPNVIYTLAFDRDRVEKALDEENVPGRAYLEKIIQLSFDVPEIAEMHLRSQVFEELDRVIKDTPEEYFDQERWPDVYYEVIDPLIGNMRDVSRFAVSALPAVDFLGNQVEITDILAMEAIRVFRPDVFTRLSGIQSILTAVNEYDDPRREGNKAIVDQLMKDLGDEAPLFRNLVRRVFPAAQRYTNNTSYGYDSQQEWRRKHLLAHIDFLSLYFTRTPPPELDAFRAAEEVFPLLGDGKKLDRYFRGLDRGILEDVLGALEAYQRLYTSDMVVAGSVVLLNLIPDIPKRASRGMFDINRPEIAVSRVVLRLLNSIADEDGRESAVTQILPNVTTYSSQLDLIELVGRKKDVGSDVVSEKFAKSIEKDFFGRVQENPPGKPDKEWNAIRVYLMLAKEVGNAPLRGKSNKRLIRAVFTSAMSHTRSQSFDSRVAKTTAVLGWEVLLTIFGDEEAIRSAVDKIRVKGQPDEVVDLVDKYLNGWRPEHD